MSWVEFCISEASQQTMTTYIASRTARMWLLIPWRRAPRWWPRVCLRRQRPLKDPPSCLRWACHRHAAPKARRAANSWMQCISTYLLPAPCHLWISFPAYAGMRRKPGNHCFRPRSSVDDIGLDMAVRLPVRHGILGYGSPRRLGFLRVQ